MCKRPYISVVIPTFNREKIISRAIESVLSQTYKNFELIIVDNGSTDETTKIVEQFNDNRVIYHWQKGTGSPAGPRNTGIRLSRGEFIAFLDSDDWWYPNKLQIVQECTNYSNVIYHDLDFFSEKGRRKFSKARGRKLRGDVFVDMMVNGNAVANSSVVIRKNIIEKVGGYDEDTLIIALEDYDLMLRIAKVTNKFHYIPLSLGAYYCGDDNLTDLSERQANSIRTVFQKHAEALCDKDKYQAKTLIAYSIGRIKFKKMLFNESLKYFRESINSKIINIKMRSILFITISWIKKTCSCSTF